MEAMSGRAKWIKVFLEEDGLSSVHIFPDADFKTVAGNIYQNCDWEFSDGVFKLTGTRKHWKEHGRVWRKSIDHIYGGWENEKYISACADKYENPKHTTGTLITGMLWWKKVKTYEVWANGNYILKGGERDTFIFTGDMAVFIMDGERMNMDDCE